MGHLQRASDKHDTEQTEQLQNLEMPLRTCAQGFYGIDHARECVSVSEGEGDQLLPPNNCLFVNRSLQATGSLQQDKCH